MEHKIQLHKELIDYLHNLYITKNVDYGDSVHDTYTKYGLIGSFETDEGWNICNLYPNKDIKDKYTDGSLVGELSSNKLVQYVRDVEEQKPVKIIEQWGESVPVDGVITFPEAYNKLMYVVANGVKILSKSNTGFTVEPTNEEISWMAKGI